MAYKRKKKKKKYQTGGMINALGSVANLTDPAIAAHQASLASGMGGIGLTSSDPNPISKPLFRDGPLNTAISTPMPDLNGLPMQTNVEQVVPMGENGPGLQKQIRAKKEANLDKIGNAISGVVGTASNALVPGIGPLVSLGLGAGLDAMMKPSPTRYTPIRENTNPYGPKGRAKGGKLSYQRGGDIQLNSQALQIKGNPSEVDGEERVVQGNPVRLDHNEVIGMARGGPFAFSDVLKDSNGITFAKKVKPYQKAIGKAEEKNSPEAQTTVKLMQGIVEQIAKENNEAIMKDDMKKSEEGYAKGGKVPSYKPGGRIPPIGPVDNVTIMFAPDGTPLPFQNTTMGRRKARYIQYLMETFDVDNPRDIPYRGRKEIIPYLSSDELIWLQGKSDKPYPSSGDHYKNWYYEKAKEADADYVPTEDILAEARNRTKEGRRKERIQNQKEAVDNVAPYTPYSGVLTPFQTPAGKVQMGVYDYLADQLEGSVEKIRSATTSLNESGQAMAQDAIQGITNTVSGTAQGAGNTVSRTAQETVNTVSGIARGAGNTISTAANAGLDPRQSGRSAFTSPGYGIQETPSGPTNLATLGEAFTAASTIPNSPVQYTTDIDTPDPQSIGQTAIDISNIPNVPVRPYNVQDTLPPRQRTQQVPQTTQQPTQQTTEQPTQQVTRRPQKSIGNADLSPIPGQVVLPRGDNFSLIDAARGADMKNEGYRMSDRIVEVSDAEREAAARELGVLPEQQIDWNAIIEDPNQPDSNIETLPVVGVHMPNVPEGSWGNPDVFDSEAELRAQFPNLFPDQQQTAAPRRTRQRRKTTTSTPTSTASTPARTTMAPLSPLSSQTQTFGAKAVQANKDKQIADLKKRSQASVDKMNVDAAVADREGFPDYLVGDILQGASLTGKFLDLTDGPEKTSLQRMPTRQIDDRPFVEGARQAFNAQQANMGSAAYNRSAQQANYVNYLDNLTKARHQIARTNKGLAAQADQFNIGQANLERDINARKRAAYDAARDRAFETVGTLGQGINQRKQNRQAVAMIAPGYEVWDYYVKDVMQRMNENRAGATKKKNQS